MKVGLNTTKQTNKQKHITTKVGSLNPAHREVYLIQYFVIKFVIGDLSRFWWSYLGPLVYLLTTLLILFGFPTFRFWAYLMKVIPETRCAHKIWYLRFIVSELRQVSGFLRVLWFLPPIKLTAKIWLKYCWKLW